MDLIKHLLSFESINERNLLIIYLLLDIKTLEEEKNNNNQVFKELCTQYRKAFEVSDYLYSVSLGFLNIDKMAKFSDVEGQVVSRQPIFTAMARKSCYLLSMKEIDSKWQRHIV